MGMILTEHLSYHAGALFVRLVACIADTHHTIKYPPVYGFEAVADVGKRTRHYHRH